MSTVMLYTFMIAASTGSIAETAKKLRYSKSTVLYHIREVEKACGAELVERDVRRFTLTRSGQKALEISEQLLRKADELKSLPTGDSRGMTTSRPRGVNVDSPKNFRPSGRRISA
ncbi:LysR family transcriptional regulator [Streptomyces sp. NPDC058375]|uniref:LysR family transcriptional regulator n=1 Tax=Streptomyces sp. NPDC058375 TaxID=3346467 RepID=UPI0036660CAE